MQWRGADFYCRETIDGATIDDNGIAGPHRLELETVTITTTVTKGADEVELGLGLDQVSLVLGDFDVPADCLGPTLVGFSARFPVEPPE